MFIVVFRWGLKSESQESPGSQLSRHSSFTRHFVSLKRRSRSLSPKRLPPSTQASHTRSQSLPRLSSQPSRDRPDSPDTQPSQDKPDLPDTQPSQDKPDLPDTQPSQPLPDLQTHISRSRSPRHRLGRRSLSPSPHRSPRSPGTVISRSLQPARILRFKSFVANSVSRVRTRFTPSQKPDGFEKVIKVEIKERKKEEKVEKREFYISIQTDNFFNTHVSIPIPENSELAVDYVLKKTGRYQIKKYLPDMGKGNFPRYFIA